MGGSVVFAESGLPKTHALLGKSPYTSVRSEIVVERTVFLDKNDNVLDRRQLG